MRTIKRLVVKVGTAELTGVDGKLNCAFQLLAEQIARLRRNGIRTVVVSSGAILAGRQANAALGINGSKMSKKLLAACGMDVLITRWREAFAPYGLSVCQLLATFYNSVLQDERRSIRSTLREAMDSGRIVPIVNENDPVSPAEIKLMDLHFSENDVLASVIANIVGANAIIFFSDAGGVYEHNPRAGDSGRKYRTLDAWNIPRVLLPKRSAVASASALGRGGIESKITAAARCHRAGMRVAIAKLNGTPEILRQFVRGGSVGTMMGSKTVFYE